MFNLNESKLGSITRQRQYKESLMLFAVRKVSDFSFSLLRASKKFLVNLAVISLLLEQFLFVTTSSARAADLPITPDGSTNTQIDRAANNVPIVNIAAPNAGGLSHNKYNDYNVNQSGLILNNAIGSQNGVTQTQIGGLINDNANLKNSGAASIILNEVTSNNISQINGYTEIAGKKADLVLANPNGFVMNGAGFVNVSRFSAVVGSSNQFNPNPNDLTFRLSDNAYAATHGFLPKLTIMGSGIDLEDITSTDLVANLMNIVAPVYGGANDVNLRTGDQTFNYLTKTVTSDNTNPGSNLPSEVAIDASALGKIQAGRIFIVATKEGFGIKYSGDLLASRSGIIIDNQGNIDYNNIASEVGDILVTSQKGSITQSGISQTKDLGSDITLNAFGNITNSGQFVSARNIKIDSGATFKNDSAALNLSDNDFTIDAVDFTNLGQISANLDLKITATTSLKNSSKLVAGRELTLSSAQITNDDSIYAGNKINITASNYLTNNKDIISLGLGLVEAEDGSLSGNADDGIEITAKTLNNQSQIASKNNITINSDALNNLIKLGDDETTGTILALGDIDLNVVTIDNSNAEIQAKKNLTLRNLVLNAADVATQFSVTNQTTSITNAGGSFYAGSLLDFDLGNLADYTITGSLQSAGSSKIKANNIVNNGDIQSDGTIEIEAADKFVNGVLSGDNSNTKIVSGTDLKITSNNLLSNYATLSSGTDLSLTSKYGNINNNVNAEIVAGKRYQVELEDGSKAWVNSGKLNLSAKNGTVYQNSLHSLVSNGDLTLDVDDFENTGRVDIAGTFTLNVANNLVNYAGAMIYSGGNMELNVVNNLTNNENAVIHSDGTLTIQKYAETSPSYVSGNNSANQIDNIAATIESSGKLTINSKALNNTGINYDPDGSGFFGYNKNLLVSKGGWGEGYFNLMNQDEIVSTLRTKQAKITSSGNIEINNAAVKNYSSSISASGNIAINNGSLNNETASILVSGLQQKYGKHSTSKKCSWTGSCNTNHYYDTSWSTYSANATSADVANIKAGGSFTLNGVAQVNNGYQNSFTGATIALSSSRQTVIEEAGTVDVDLTSYFQGSENVGLFTKNQNPNGPLFETRSQFIDQSKYFGSDYFYQRIGLDLTDVNTQFELQSKRLVGDQFFQTKIIEEQLKTISKNSFLLSANETSVNGQIKTLLDNAVEEYVRLGLTTNTTLTKTQIDSLQKDIVWFETKTIDGATYIVPTIYLTQATRTALKNGNFADKSTIYAGGDININSTSGSVKNTGSIIGNNVSVVAANDIVNQNFSNITALDSLSLTSTAGSITNFSQLKATGALSLSAAKDITNTSAVLTNDSSLLASNGNGISSYVSNNTGSDGRNKNISSEILETAGISSGNLTINAGGDFTNLAANIVTTGNAEITAGDDINIATLELRNRTEKSWGNSKKGGSSVSDVTTNISSNISSLGSLALIASGSGIDSETSGKLQGSNIQITGSNLSASDGITLAAQDDVNIEAAQNTSYFESKSWKQGLTVSKSSISGNQSVTNVLSNLTSDSGNISITSGSDTNLIGAKLKAEDVEIAAGDEVNIYSVSDQNKSWASSTKSRSFSGIAGGLVGVSFIANIAPLTLGGLILANQGLSSNDSSKSSSQTAEKTSNLASVIDASGAVSIAANQDLTVLGSNISGKTGSLVSDQGSVNILAAQEIEKTTSSNSETARATNVPGFKGVKHTSSESTENITNIASNLTFTDSLAIQTNGNSLDSEQKADVNIKGSNLTVTDGDLTIASKGNVTIENAIDSAFKESSSKKRNETTKSFSTSTDYVETAASSNLSANNINISSLGDTTIQGSNVDTKENLIIGSFTIAQNSDGSYQKDANGNYVTTAGTTVDNLTIKDADLKEYHYAQSGKGYTGVAGAAMRALPYALAPLQIASSITKDYMSTYFPDFYEDFIMKATPIGLSMKLVDKAGDKMGAIRISESTESRTDKTNSHASNINVGGSMMTNSVGDTLVKGSNLNISGDLLANSLGSFTVAAGTNTESSTSQSSYETAGKFHSEYQSTKLNYRAGVTKEFVEEGSNSSSSTVASSNVNIGGSALVNSSDEFALLASNFVTGSSAEIIAKNNLSILDGQNKQSSSSYLDKLTLDTGIQVGNAYADAAYAIVDAVKAQKAVKDAYDKLEKIEDLKGQGMASSKAVERAKYQVVLALINAGLSSAAAMQAVGNAGNAALTSMGTGFYGSVYADITKLKSTTTSEYSQSVASNLIAGDSLSLTSGTGDINITGSNVSATNGDLNLTAMLGNLNVNAGESTASQSYKMRSQSLGGSVGNNGFSANIGMNEAESSQDQTTYTNSQILAQNGSLNINTGKDTNLFGANLLASNVNMDVGGNLLLKSRQNLSESDSYNIGMSLGISGDSSGANGGSVGFSLGNGYSNRAWVDQVSSIIGTNSVNINVDNNTNIAGAVIANKDKDGNDLGNLNLSTASLTYSDLKNFSVSESNQLGLNLQVGKNPNNPTANGNLAINLSMQGSESSSNTKATVGQGNINVGGSLNDETKLTGLNRDINNTEQNKKTVVTSDFEASLKIDIRLLSAAGNLMIGDTKAASANWNSYVAETQRGFNITYDALAIPLNSLGKTISGDVNGSDAILATGKNYQNLYQLAYNQNIVLTDLAGEGKLIAYDGNQLDATAQARYADGFYDRNSDTAAINADSNRSDSSLAGSAAHEGGHRMFNNNGQSYTLSEENASHMIGDFAESRWDTYQSGNTSLRASLPTSSINFNNNFYANNVKFGNDVNPSLNKAIDLASLIQGSASLTQNLNNKNYLGAAVDAGGVAIDSIALFTVLPSGAGLAIKAARAADKTADGVKYSQRERVIANINESKAARESSNFSTYVKNEGKVQEDLGIWPPNDGFEGNIHYNAKDALSPGYEFDRYGKNTGRFVAPKDTPFENRSLQSAAKNQGKSSYVVVKPIENIVTGTSIPWFGQTGRGLQNKLPDSIKNLESQGYIKKTN